MIKDFGAIFKQAKEIQSKMEEVRNELAKKTVEVSTGGGMVKVTANGLNQIQSINVDDDLINMQDREILEDLLVGAMNEIGKKVQEMNQEEMGKITGGLKLPGMFSS